LPKLESSTGGLGLSDEVLESTKDILGLCSSDIYLLLSQLQMGIQDIAFSPFLKQMVEAKSAGNAGVVMREVLGFKGEEGEDLVRYVQEKCGAVRSSTMPPSLNGKGKIVVLKQFPALTGKGEEREKMVGDHGTSSLFKSLEIGGRMIADLKNRCGAPTNPPATAPRRILHTALPYHLPTLFSPRLSPLNLNLRRRLIPTILRERHRAHGSQAQFSLRASSAATRPWTINRPETAV
jgi:hypothetical protein